MEIPSFTPEEIADFNNLNAFAIDRITSASDTLSLDRNIRTDRVGQSLALVNQIIDRLGTVESNLINILDFTIAGDSNTISDAERDKFYGIIRSLTAGIDIFVRDFTLEETPLLDGTSLNLATGSTPLRLNLDSVSTYKDGGLNLSRKEDGAIAKIDFDLLSLLKNTQSNLLGLDISEANYKKPATGETELDSGKYQLRITYEGPASTVEITKLDGSVIKRVENVDLSGEGQELVDTGVGVELSFEKTFIKTLLGGDKYDYETLGPTTLYAVLEYERKSTYVIRNEDNKINSTSTVKLQSSGSVNSSTGTLGLSVERSGVRPDKTEFESGQHRVEVKYNGSDSSVWVYNTRGVLVGLERNIDLSQQGETTINLGSGVKFVFDNDNFGTEKRTFSQFFDYQKAQKASSVFDFKEYQDRVLDALVAVQNQIFALQDAAEQLTLQGQLANPLTRSSAFGGSAVAAGQSASSIIAGAVDPTLNGILSPSQADAEFSLTAATIFQNTSAALSAQGNFTEVDLNKLLNTPPPSVL